MTHARVLTLPGTSRSISKIGLGCMSLSLPGRPDRAMAMRVIQAAVEEGITLLDTADCYALHEGEVGHNERLVRDALANMGIRVEDGPVTVATKGGRTRIGGEWGIAGRPEQLRKACERSLLALGVERIPLYQLHTPDPEIPLEDAVGELVRLREEGKIEAIGLSNISIQDLKRAQKLTVIASVQNRLIGWDPGFRVPPLVRTCAQSGVIFLAYSPLGGRDKLRKISHSTRLADTTTTGEYSLPEVVLAWMAAEWRPVIPIPGASRVATALSIARASTLQLTARELRAVGRGLRRGSPGGTLPGRIFELVRSRLKSYGQL